MQNNNNIHSKRLYLLNSKTRANKNNVSHRMHFNPLFWVKYGQTQILFLLKFLFIFNTNSSAILQWY